MFCPRCSQEQVSENTKFCSRCGFPLGLVAEVLAHDGFLPQLAEINTNKSLWTRKNGMLFAFFWFMLFSLILTPLFGIIDVDALAAMCAVLGTMGGIFLAVFSLVYLRKEPKNIEAFNQAPLNHKSRNFYEAQHNALPPQHSQTAQSYVSPTDNWKAPDTGELVQPDSVTDGTTRLLKNQD